MRPQLLIILLLSPIGIVFMHAVFARLFKKSPNRQSICLQSVMFGYGLLFLALGLTMELTLAVAIYAIIVYAGIGYSYFHVFNMSETARRVRMLREIDMAGRMSPKDLEKSYPAREMLSVRIERLISVGQIHEKRKRYILGGRQLYYIAKLIDLWGRLIKMPLMK